MFNDFLYRGWLFTNTLSMIIVLLKPTIYEVLWETLGMYFLYSSMLDYKTSIRNQYD